MADFDYDSKLDLQTKLSPAECRAALQADSTRSYGPSWTGQLQGKSGIAFSIEEEDLRIWRSRPLARLSLAPVFYGKLKPGHGVTAISGKFRIYPPIRITGIVLMFIFLVGAVGLFFANTYFLKLADATWIAIVVPLGIAVSLLLRFYFHINIIGGKRDIASIQDFLRDKLKAFIPE